MKKALIRKEAIRLAAKKYRVTEAAIRQALWRKSRACPHQSYKCAFSEEEEKLLEQVCVIHARQGTALSRQEFIELASIFAGKDKDHPFSSRFVDGFLERHKAVLVSRRETITSPTRCLGTTLEKTKEFISTLTEYMMRNTMNKRNTFVF